MDADALKVPSGFRAKVAACVGKRRTAASRAGARAATPATSQRSQTTSRPAYEVRFPGTAIRVVGDFRFEQNDDGSFTDPPVSEPSAHGAKPAETAHAEPPPEPPGTRVGSQGLHVGP